MSVTALQDLAQAGCVTAVSAERAHRFGKAVKAAIRLIKDHGIEDDAHAGPLVAHRYLARQTPALPNLRQVHLIPSELFADLKRQGFAVTPGELGENITTTGIDLLRLPLGSLLQLGDNAVVELTGLRTPCGQIDKFQRGLKRRMIVRGGAGVTFRAGVFAVVRESGELRAGDCITVTLPAPPWAALPAL